MVLLILRVFSLLPLLFLSQAVPSAAPSTLAAGTVTFEIKNAGFRVEGSFSDLQTTLRFDPSQWANTQLEASVAANTIKTGIRLRDEHLQGRGYFAAEKYPRIRLVLTQIMRKGGPKYQGTFNLTIRGVTRPVIFPFSYVAAGSRLQGSFTINRRDFGVGGSSFTLADNVTVRLDVPVPPRGQ